MYKYMYTHLYNIYIYLYNNTNGRHAISVPNRCGARRHNALKFF